MATIYKELEVKIRSLSDTGKLKPVDSILTQLDRPDPEIDRIWTEEARNRWRAYKAGKLEAFS
ncbi:addiction module protein [Candidatus Kuenenia stuttgartiensis]|uniref:Addiction module protein n=1 Tax=Kuenenia stuttgartiensis TaxID=174633 RepID=A0A6G7GIJ8_KUEST|nr:addiction module protein [Candidatus Kuenenia stuttgartiensis]QII09440.1 addiction module protein [Candidatus Kuenenia stuttgartiensis]